MKIREVKTVILLLLILIINAVIKIDTNEVIHFKHVISNSLKTVKKSIKMFMQ